jgi:hypothetical protein
MIFIFMILINLKMSHPHYSEFHGLEIKIRYSEKFTILRVILLYI